MLGSMLARVAKEFTYERAKKFGGNQLANYIRNDLAQEAGKHLFAAPSELTIKGSAGAGNWAAVPWLGFFDPLVTNSATRGFYVVYLINPIDETFVLSMNQGTTEVVREFGQTRGRVILARRAEDMCDRIYDLSDNFSREDISLGSTESLPLGYEAGHAFGRTYSAENFEEKAIAKDLEDMLTAYAALVDRGGITPTEIMQEEAGGETIEETRRYVLSRRIERSPRVRKAVIASRGTYCEACGLDPFVDFNFSGRAHEAPLDVHHARPLRDLMEGETRRYVVPDDFLILCPTCHRMIHKQDDPSDLAALKAVIRFKYLRQISPDDGPIY